MKKKKEIKPGKEKPPKTLLFPKKRRVGSDRKMFFNDFRRPLFWKH